MIIAQNAKFFCRGKTGYWVIDIVKEKKNILLLFLSIKACNEEIFHKRAILIDTSKTIT